MGRKENVFRSLLANLAARGKTAWSLSQIIVQGDLNFHNRKCVNTNGKNSLSLYYHIHGTIRINLRTETFSFFVGREIIGLVFYHKGVRRVVKDTVEKGLDLPKVEVGNIQVVNLHFHACFEFNFETLVGELIPFLLKDCEFDIEFKQYQQEGESIPCTLGCLKSTFYLKSISQLYLYIKDRYVKDKEIILKFMRSKNSCETHCTVISPTASPQLFLILDIIEHFQQ